MNLSGNKNFGEELMRLVASKLRLGSTMINNHRDYCGYSLAYKDGKYIMGLSYDGVLEQNDVIYHWHSKESFIDFFAPLTDYKCSGNSKSLTEYFSQGPVANQRITKSRLISFLGEYSLCPHCNEILRGAHSKQCPHCYKKWYSDA